MTYKFITIEQDDGICNSKPSYTVTNNKSGDKLGKISYYPRWKTYVFDPDDGTCYSMDCLKDIYAFMKSL